MTNKRRLTGIKPTGTPHIGNYISAIRPSVETAHSNSFFFIADYHAITTLKNKELIQRYTLDVATTWIACGLDPEKVTFYKQSDIPELLEAYWILMSSCPKGLLNRGHAYKYSVQENQKKNKPIDEGINMGVYTYPALMAADILLFSAEEVPVGADQLQHIEITRDIAEKFNAEYRETFILPTAILEQTKDIPGIDGQKMSKSYKNTIELFSDKKIQEKQIMKIKTDTKGIEESKDPDQCKLFYLFSLFASKEETEELRRAYKKGGVGYGTVKKKLAENIQLYFKEAKEKYHNLKQNPEKVENILSSGAIKARKIAKKKLEELKQIIGIKR
ncbi:MAG: tryptophan--tRNA ligase [bacterium]